MDRNLIDTLRKVLALTTSPAEGEAQAAAATLARLLSKHNLSIADLESKGAAKPGVRERGHDLGKAAFKWKLDLAEGIAEFYYCAPMINRITKTVAFVGRPDNVDALTMLYVWVIEQVKGIATTERRAHHDTTGEHIDPLRWQVNFGEGAVIRLVGRLRELKARQQEDMARNEDGDVVGLTLHHSAEASDYLEENYGYRLDGKLTKKQQEREDRYQREREAQDEMKIRCQGAGDMEPYYKAYPWERPTVVTDEQRVQWAKEEEEARKREARNAKRRTGRREAAVDWDKEVQADTARKAGNAAAGKVNLQPFISSGNAKGELR